MMVSSLPWVWETHDDSFLKGQNRIQCNAHRHQLSSFIELSVGKPVYKEKLNIILPSACILPFHSQERTTLPLPARVDHTVLFAS